MATLIDFIFASPVFIIFAIIVGGIAKVIVSIYKYNAERKPTLYQTQPDLSPNSPAQKKMFYEVYDEIVPQLPKHENVLRELRERLIAVKFPMPPVFLEGYIFAFERTFRSYYNYSDLPTRSPDNFEFGYMAVEQFRETLRRHHVKDMIDDFVADYEEASKAFPQDISDITEPRFHTTFGDCIKSGRLREVAAAIGVRSQYHLTHFETEEKKLDYKTHPEIAPAYNRIANHYRDLLDVPIPLEIKDRTRHTHIIGNSGSGKTNLIEHMVARDLVEGAATVIVIDSQRQMIPNLASLDIPLDEVSYISPRHNFGINFFDVGLRGVEDYDDERMTSSATELIEYVLGELIAAGFTDKQIVPFQFSIQLMMVIPEANLRTFRKLMESDDAEPYRQHFHKLAPDVREFFETQFFDLRLYKETKKEIGWRIWSLMRHPTFRRLFSATHNRFDMYEEINKRSLILIDTDENLLKQISGTFGRIFIAQLLHVAQRRFEGTHRPVYVYIDECYAYFDDRLSQMLETARKANIGLILAHQHLGHKNIEKVLPAIKNSTTTKFCGMVDPDVARAMAPQLHTTAEVIRTLPPYHFALTMGDRQVYTVSAPKDPLANAGKRTDEIQAEMERRYGYTPPTEPEPVEEFEHEDKQDEIRPSPTL